jgi:hypothetical protein
VQQTTTVSIYGYDYVGGGSDNNDDNNNDDG